MPYKRSDGKVFGSGSGTSTIIIDPEHLTYTRTIVFSDLSTPVDESYVHDKLMNLPGFPINVNLPANLFIVVIGNRRDKPCSSWK